MATRPNLYEISTAYSDFCPSNVTIQYVDNEKNKALYYKDTLIDSGRRMAVKAGSQVGSRELTQQEAISLWQQCYLSCHTSYDASECARLYRQVNGICHSCSGDGVVTPHGANRSPVPVTCDSCGGSGAFTNKEVNQWLD